MKRGGIAAILFGVVVAVFSVATMNDLVRYDDYDYIARNGAISDGLSPRVVRWAFTAAGYASNYHPLTWLSHAADVSLAKTLGIPHRQSQKGAEHLCREEGAFARLIHAENVLLHAANAVLLWLLMLVFGRTFKGMPPPTNLKQQTSNFELQTANYLVAAFFALLWALHPLRVEVVAWASERKELLSTFFMLLTMLAYVRRGSNGHGGLIETALPICFFILALLSKPMAVSLPVVLFAYEWALQRRGFRDTFRRLLPYVGLSAFFCHMTMISQGDGLMGGMRATTTQKILASVEAPLVYAWQTIWPSGLTIDYAFPDWSSWPVFVGGVLLLVAMAVFCVLYVWRRAGKSAVDLLSPPAFLSYTVFAIAWVYVGLIPVLGIVKVGYEPHSDRYTYWIGCGGALMCAQTAVWAYGKWGAVIMPHREKIAYAGVALLVLLGVMSFRQCGIWLNSETLFASVVQATGNENFAHALDERLMFLDSKNAQEAELMLRDVLQRKRSAEARAALAYHLAIFADAYKPISFVGSKMSAFTEARLFAKYALEDGDGGHDWACAALAFADYREEKYDSAIAWMKKAKDLGFESGFIKIDIERWKKKAEEKRNNSQQNKEKERK